MCRPAGHYLRYVPLLIAIVVLLSVIATAAAPPAATAKGLPRARLGRPHLPSFIVTGAPFKVRGTLRPHHADGAQSVKIKCFLQDENGAWVFQKTVWATNHDFGSHHQVRRLRDAGCARLSGRVPSAGDRAGR